MNAKIKMTPTLSTDSGPDVVRFHAGPNRSLVFEVRVKGEGLDIRAINPLGAGDGMLQVLPNAGNSITVQQRPMKCRAPR